MASIRKEIDLAVPAAHVWAAVRDVGAVHHRLARGFVTDVKLEGRLRIVTFANGFVVQEALLDIDDERRRLAYAATGGRTSHHHATMEVISQENGRSRLIWVTDLLPDSAAEAVAAMVEVGAAAIRRTLEYKGEEGEYSEAGED